jgi:hypothetical protein
MRAFARPKLRPYLPDLRFLRTVGQGLCVLCTGARAAVRRGVRAVLGVPAKRPASREEMAEAADRAGMGLLVLAVAGASGAGVVATVGRHLVPYLPWVVGGVVLVVVGVACAAAPGDTPRKKIVKAGGVAPAPPPPGQAPPLDVAAVARAVRAVAVPNGWLGAHLDDVLAHLPGHSRGQLLDVLAEAGIPVAEQLKLTLPGGRQRNRQGVRLSTLPAGLGEAPPTPAPGPPQPAPEVPAHPPPRVPHLTVHRGE